jgi:hypothetical protein
MPVNRPLNLDQAARFEKLNGLGPDYIGPAGFAVTFLQFCRKYLVQFCHLIAPLETLDLPQRILRSAVETATAQLAEARAETGAFESQLRSVQTEIERSTIPAPLDTEVLQVKLRVGEFALAASTAAPLILLGRLTFMCGSTWTSRKGGAFGPARGR